MRKSVLLGLGGVAILGGWVLKNLLSDKAENAENSAKAGANAFANAKNSAQSEKGCFRDELGEFSQKQFKGDFDGENLPFSENFTQREKKMTMRDLERLQEPYYDEKFEELLDLVESGKKPEQAIIDYLSNKGDRVGHNQLKRSFQIAGDRGIARMDKLADEADEICAIIEQIGEEEFERRVEAVLNGEDET